MQAEADPNLIVCFNGRYMPLGEARIGILTHALHYGTGVFEGIRAYWDQANSQLCLFRANDHFERWLHNCGILHLSVPHPPEELSDIAVELLHRNHFRTSVYLRPIAYKSAERVGVSPDDRDSWAIVALPFGDYLPTSHGLHAGVSAWRRIADNAIPPRGKICGAYVNSALASDDARREGFDEAILLNESGRVAEGATCNLFLIRQGTLATPLASENVLEGITRDSILRLARRELGLPVVERPIDRSELYVSDEMFLTGTAVGIAPVVRVDHRPVGDGSIGVLTTHLRELYFQAAMGRMPEYRRWVVPVPVHEPLMERTPAPTLSCLTQR